MAPEPTIDERLRDLLRHHRFEIGPDALAVRLQAFEHARPRARRDDDVLGSVITRPLGAARCRCVGLGYCDFAGAGDLGLAPDDGHLVLLQEAVDALGELRGRFARMLDDLVGVIANAGRRDAEALPFPHLIVQFGRAQQRLGRDAAPVEADAAEMAALDHGGLEAQLRSADRGDIAARSGADNDHVKGFVGHSLSSVCLVQPCGLVRRSQSCPRWAPGKSAARRLRNRR